MIRIFMDNILILDTPFTSEASDFVQEHRDVKFTVTGPPLNGIEEWLEADKYAGMSNEEYLHIMLAETGADRETGFDIEAQQELYYDAWLDTIVRVN